MNKLYDDASKLKEELRGLFRERNVKGHLMQELALRLNNYAQLKGTPFQAAISEFIVLYAEEYCEIIIHDEEVSKIWY